ncbi:hypothetical protein OJ253_2767, partial [Cryptosporidium canis]
MPCILYRKENVRSGLIHPNGKMIALLVSSTVHTIELYRIDNPVRPIKLLWSYQIRDRPSCLDWCNNARSICIGDARGSITIIDVDGHISSHNSIHSQYSEIRMVRSFTVGEGVISLKREGIFPRRLKELIPIEPYSLSTRSAGQSEIISLDELLSDFNFSLGDGDLYPDSQSGNCTGEWEGSVGRREALSEDRKSASQGDSKEAPRLLPEYADLDEICLFLTVDSKDNMICTIGGHTPVWVYNLRDHGQGDGRVLRDVGVCGSQIFLTYGPEKERTEEDFLVEIVDMKRFLDSFGLVFNTFGFLQYTRQLLTFLRGVFKQIHQVWTTGIKPFRQFLSNDKALQKSHMSILLLSIITGTPVNMFHTGSLSPAEISINIDQLVMIGQNINDSMVYIENTMSRTVDPAVHQIVIMWSILQRTELMEDQETSKVSEHIRMIREFNENLSSEVEQVKPIVHTFLHLISIAKTYKEDIKGVSSNHFSPPKIISSVNSNIIASTFGLSEDSYYTLRDFVESRRLCVDENLPSMDDESQMGHFFSEIEFRRVDKLLNEDTEGCSLACVSGLGTAIDKIYKLAVRKVSQSLVQSVSSLRVRLDTEFFSARSISNSVHVSLDDLQNVIIKSIHPVKNEEGRYVISKICVRGDEFSSRVHSYESTNALSDPTGTTDYGEIQVEYCSKTFSPSTNKVSVSCATICLPDQLCNHKIASAVWTPSNGLLVLIDNGSKSSILFEFNLDLIKLRHPLATENDEPLDPSLGSSLARNRLDLSFKVCCPNDEQGHAKTPDPVSLDATNLSNIFHRSQDISRIHRPPKFRNLSTSTSGSKDASSPTENGALPKEPHANAEILDFHSTLNQKCFVVADCNAGRIAIGSL